MQTDLYIGPVIERSGDFGYETFSVAEGARGSFRYRRVEQALHDRRSIIAEAESNPQWRVHVCETVAEFDARTNAARKSADLIDNDQPGEP